MRVIEGLPELGSHIKPVVVGLRVGVERAVDVVERLAIPEAATVDLPQREPQVDHKVPHANVLGVDERAPVLDFRPLFEEGRIREAPPAKAAGVRLVQGRGNPKFVQPVGASQARQAAADDDDPDVRVDVAREGGTRHAEQGGAQSGPREAQRRLQEVPPVRHFFALEPPALQGRGPFLVVLTHHLLDGHVPFLGFPHGHIAPPKHVRNW